MQLYISRQYETNKLILSSGSRWLELVKSSNHIALGAIDEKIVKYNSTNI